MTCGPGDTLVLLDQGYWICEHPVNLKIFIAISSVVGILFALWMLMRKKKTKHRPPNIRELLEILIKVTQENNHLLHHIRLCVCKPPQLSHFEVKLMDLTLNVGQSTVATITNAIGSDGAPFTIDPTTVGWSLSDPALATQVPQSDGSDQVTAVAAGSEVVTAQVGPVSNFGTLTILAPSVPTLASFDVSFSPATP